MGFLRAVGQAANAVSAGADRFARTVGNQLWPQWQGGLQDAQSLFTRMTLDQPPLASVPGQGGVSTQRELYDLAHPDPGPTYAEYQAERQAAATEAPAREAAPDNGRQP